MLFYILVYDYWSINGYGNWSVIFIFASAYSKVDGLKFDIGRMTAVAASYKKLVFTMVYPSSDPPPANMSLPKIDNSPVLKPLLSKSVAGIIKKWRRLRRCKGRCIGIIIVDNPKV
ncbi:MAG: hypothetical protein PVH63_04875 [Balneolaceae bacterium]|jgi:hypothetical protein